ncbi:MAG: trigger factor, partial [Verrucomicrobia bacterium]
MNVTVEPLAPCKKLVRVEVETKSVDEAFETITKEFQRQASFPGFRPGKAPREMVLRKYESDIQDEVKRKLISQAYKKAVEEQNLEVIGQPDIEEVQFSRGQPLQFNANVETAPEFELPEYRGLLVKMEARTLTDADVDRALEALREPKAGFQKMDRAVQTGDVAVVNYTGTCEGKPITEIAPTAQGLTAKSNFWVETPSKSFLPGFGDQLIGAKAGEKRTVTVDFPADFVTPQLAGKQGVYEVEVVEVKEKVLPPVDDNLAKAYGAEDLAKLRDGVRKDLENEVSYNRKKSARDQVVRGLLDRVNFELPESAVGQETRQVVNNIVQDVARRGGSRADVERQKE